MPEIADLEANVGLDGPDSWREEIYLGAFLTADPSFGIPYEDYH